MSLVRIKLKGDTAANFTASNIVLLVREWAYETDTFTLSGGVRHYKFKIGDGSTAWNDLPYARLSAVGGGGGASAFIDLTDVPGAYTGAAGRYVKVNETADGLEFEVIEAADLPTGIDAAKIADGTVSNAEFQTLNGAQQPYTTAEQTKLAEIETGADVTDAANVDAAGAVMNSDASTAAMQFVIDEDSFASNLDTKVPTQQSVKAYADAREVAAKAYADTLVVGLVDDRGNYDASVNTFPASGGSGTAGAILKGDLWTVSVAGTLGGTPVTAGDLVRALVDTPGQTAANWAVTENNIGYVAENQANKENTTLDSSTTKYPTNRLVKEYTDAKVADSISNGVTTIAPSQNAVFDALALKADDSAVVHDTGDETIAGVKTFSSDPIIPDEAYGVGWNGSLEPATKNALYDKIETLSAGGLTNWTEARTASAPNATVPVVSFAPNTADTNNDSVILTKGTGSLLAQIPDSGTGGGNKRGTYSVDLQRVRSNANHVCLGNYQVIVGGQANQLNSGATGSVIVGGNGNVSIEQYSFQGSGASNTITGSYGVVVGGSSNSVASSNGVIVGGNNNTVNAQGGILEGDNCQVNALQGGVLSGTYANAYLYGMQAWANGRFSAIGDAQGGRVIARRSITGTAAAEVTLDASTTRLVLSSTNCIWNFEVQMVATISSVGNGSGTAGHSFAATYGGCIKRLNTTTSLVGTIQNIMAAQADASLSDVTVAITADDTNEALKIEFTPSPSTAGSTTVTLVVATVTFTQVKY